jgi:hypothetical protein
MKRLAVATAGAAVIGLTSCSQATTPTTASTATPSSPGAATHTAPVSCSHQYHAWRDSEGKKLIAVLNAVSSAVTAANAQMLSAALKRAKPEVAMAARHPIPACADPKGYWTVLLMHVNAAATSTSSMSSMHAAVKDVPEIVHSLMTEVKRRSL